MKNIKIEIKEIELYKKEITFFSKLNKIKGNENLSSSLEKGIQNEIWINNTDNKYEFIHKPGRFEQDIQEDNYTGFAKMIYDDGDIYEGDWKDGKYDGVGKLITFDKEVYKGHFRNGLFHGEGEYNDKFGNKFIGDWMMGKKEGKGKIYLKNGDYLEGNFKNNTLNGNGISVLNGNKYEGHFLDGEYDGDGVLTLINNEKLVGYFKNNEIIDGKKFSADSNIIAYINEGIEISKNEYEKKLFYENNNLIVLKNGNLRDENYEEYEFEEKCDDYIVYKPEGMRGKKAFIKIDTEDNYLEWSGPIHLKNKSKFLKGDFKDNTEINDYVVSNNEEVAANKKFNLESNNVEESNDLDINSELIKISEQFENKEINEDQFKELSENLLKKL